MSAKQNNDASAKVEEHLKTAAKIVFGENGVATVDKTVAIATLPDTLSEEDFLASLAHVDNLVHGSARVFGHEGIAHLKKNPDLEKTELRIPIAGRSYIEHVVLREKEVRAPGSDTPKIVHGALSTKVQIYSTKNRGVMAAIKEELAAAGTKALAKKG